MTGLAGQPSKNIIVAWFRDYIIKTNFFLNGFKS